MGTFLEWADLEPFADINALKAAAMISDAEALALTVAPCLADPDSEISESQKAAVKAILRAAVLRWNEGGTGAVRSETLGSFSTTIDDRSTRRSLFWPSEIEQLQLICTTISGGSGGAFSIDTVDTSTLNHALICSINFGASYCSCGADLTGDGPLWGDG